MPEKMTELQMIEFVKKYVGTLCVQNTAAILNFHAENSVITSAQEPGSAMGRGDLLKYIEARQWAFPDFHFQATNIKAFPEKQVATFEWEVKGTFTNALKDMPPNGRKVSHSGTTELHIVNGRIVRETSFQDKGAFIAQLVQPPIDSAAGHTA
ncbi:MAG: ester cyclase [Pyrinomonadaceae bacterium]